MTKRELDTLCIDFIERLRKGCSTDGDIANGDELKDLGTWVEGVMKFRNFILECGYAHVEAEGKEL
ncbi:MAG: hypothetical protein LUD19_03015 [Clostridia bacterium]|nr:hypothetical protein [Clostridia bacterium]